MKDFTTLQVVWFILISVLWIGYFVLEGFDFGVGMLMKLLGRDEAEKRAILHTIGPVWDGNEVWISLLGFTLLYGVLAVIAGKVFFKYAGKGPAAEGEEDSDKPHLGMAY